jgi:hypothetical protein
MKYLLTLLVFVSSFATLAQTDEDAVKQVIQTAYIDGIQNRGSIEEIRKGFHSSFTMLRLMENQVKPLGIEEWIIEKAKKDNPNPAPIAKAEGNFVNVDVTGNAAVVKLELYRESKKVFTDYLVLYKFTEGWRIISKSFIVGRSCYTEILVVRR